MRIVIALLIVSWSLTVVGADPPADELQQLRAAAEATRKLAAADATVVSVESLPVKAYLAEQQLRRAARVAGLQQRIKEYEQDVTKQALLLVLRKQLAELNNTPLEQVSFDSAYGYSPTTGMLGYSKRVRLLENLPEGKSVIMVDNRALILSGLGTSEYASGKFLGIEQAILVGGKQPAYTYRGDPKPCFEAKLVDLEKLLKQP